MDDGNSWTGFLLFAGTVILFAMMYGFGAAVQSLNTGVLEDERDRGNEKAKRLLHIQNEPHRFIVTMQAVNCVMLLLSGAFSFGMAERWCRGLSARVPGIPAAAAVLLSYAVALAALTFLLICLGIMIPKRIAAKSPAAFCNGILPVVEVMMAVMTPLAWLVDSVSRLLLMAVGIDIHAKDDNVTEEDIMYMVNEGHEQGVLEASEAEMITNIFEFDDKVASDIMTHRKSVVALDGEMTLREVMDFIVRDSVNSRFPVYEEDIDNIIGILHMRDAVTFAERDELHEKPVKEIEGLLREAHFIPETKNINSLFKEMQSQKIHMEIVVDEYGQTSGIVTMEDILEEIVGNIMDEYDEEQPDIVTKENGTYELPGMTPLDDVEDTLGITFEEEDKDNFDTLNGFLISRLGHLPEDNEKGKLRYAGYEFSIVKAENKMIETVLASPVEEEKEDPEK